MNKKLIMKSQSQEEVKKLRQLTNVEVNFVSFVDAAANKRQFFLTKSEEAPVFQKDVKLIAKQEGEQKLVYGIVYEPMVEDAHGDFMVAADIEKAAHQFLVDARNVDLQHNFQAGFGEVVESYVAPVDMEVGGQLITKGTWVLVTKATDEVWNAIKSGDITGYSLAGMAEVIQKDEEAPVTEVSKEDAQAKTLFSMLKEFFVGKREEQPVEDVQKGEVLDAFHQEAQDRDIWASFSLMEGVFYDEMWNSAPDLTRLETAAQDFITLLQEIAQSPDAVAKALESRPEKVEKSGRKISQARLDEIKAAHEALSRVITEVDVQESEEDVMKAEEINALIAEQLEPLKKSLEKVTDAPEQTPVEKSEEVKAQEQAAFVEAVKALLQDELAPLKDRLDVVEKSRGITKSVEAEPQKENIWKNLF
jgi:hypothetical protein